MEKRCAEHRELVAAAARCARATARLAADVSDKARAALADRFADHAADLDVQHDATHENPDPVA